MEIGPIEGNSKGQLEAVTTFTRSTAAGKNGNAEEVRRPN